MDKNQDLPWEHPRFKTWLAVGRACHLMQQILTRALAPLEIKTTHLDILVNLYRFEAISQQELAHKLLVGRSNMSMLLPQMEKRGLIERRNDERDKRVLRLYLTPQGRDLTEQAMKIQTRVIEENLTGAPLDDCQAVASVLERVIAQLLQQDDAKALAGE